MVMIMKLSDIAKEAKVSISTVSRVINNSANVNKLKKARVLHVLEKYEYVPNSIARSLVSSCTKTIGIMTPDIRHINCAPIAFEVERTMSEYDYDTLLCNTGQKTSEQIRYLKTLASRKVDGIVLIGVSYSKPEILDTINKHLSDTPIVILNGQIEAPNISHVFGCTDRAIARLMDYLHSIGHKKIMLVKEANSWVQDLKEEVYRQKMNEYGIDVVPEYIYTIKTKLDDCQEIVKHFQIKVKDYTVIIANNDLIACGIVKYLKMSGKRIPQDISVTGYYNSDYAKLCDPALTTIDNKMKEIGEMLALALLNSIRGNKPEQTINVVPELVLRDSTIPNWYK